LATEQGAQARHLCADEGVDFGVVRAQADPVEEQEQDSHGLILLRFGGLIEKPALCAVLGAGFSRKTPLGTAAGA
jgi:hypothetical protein